MKSLGVIRAASVTKKTMRNMNISPLHCAAINPNPEFLKEFLRVTPDYNITDKRGRRPIHFAAACESTGPLKVLLDSGVPYFEPDATGGTPLYYAVQVGRLDNVKMLLDLSKKDKDGEDQNDAAQAVIEKYGPCAINKAGPGGNTPLHVACLAGNFEICQVLVDAGADVEMGAGGEKRTPLMMAASQGHLEMCQYLIEKANCLIEKRCKKGRNALIFAVKNGHAHVTAYLLHLGSNPDSQDTSGNKALHYACAYGWLGCARLLLQAGADETLENDWSMTPLAISFLKGHLGITRELLNRSGADVNFRDKNGRTLVMLTCQATISEALLKQLEALIKQFKADVTLTDIYGCNALHFLSNAPVPHFNRNQPNSDPETIRCKMAKLLIDNGCKADLENSANRTPVNIALEEFHSDLVSLLLTNGGIISAKPKNDGSLNNSLHILASSFSRQDIGKIITEIKKHCAKESLHKLIKARNSEGLTPLLLAAKTYHSWSPPGLKDSREQTEAVKMAQDFLKRLVVDFGADPKDVVEEPVEKPPNVDEDIDEDDDDDDDNDDVDEDEDEEEEDEDEEESVSDVKPATNTNRSTLVHWLLLPKTAPPALNFIIKHQPLLNLYNGEGFTAVLSAISANKWPVLEILWQNGADFNLPIKKPSADAGVPPLLYAAKKTPSLVHSLLELAKQEPKRIDLEKTLDDSNDNLASLLCATRGLTSDQRLTCLKMIKYSPHYSNKAKRNLLMLAIGSNLKKVDSNNVIEEHLLKQDASSMFATDVLKRTALHWIFLDNQGRTHGQPNLLSGDSDPVDLLNLILENVAVVDQLDSMNRTPLHYAAAAGATFCCLRLMARGADINATDVNGDTPLSLAVRLKKKSVVLALIQAKPNLKITVDNSTDFSFVQNEPSLSPKDDKKPVEIMKWRQIAVAKKPATTFSVLYGIEGRVNLFTAVIKMEWQGLTSLMIDTLMDNDKKYVWDLAAAALASANFNLAIAIFSKVDGRQDLMNIIKNNRGPHGRTLLHVFALGATCKLNQNTLGTNVATVTHLLYKFGLSDETVDDYGCQPIHYACLNQFQPLVYHFGSQMHAKNQPFKVDKFKRTPLHALFWNLHDDTHVKRALELLQFVVQLDKSINLTTAFAPLVPATPESRNSNKYVVRDYFIDYGVDVVNHKTLLNRAVETGNYNLVANLIQKGANPRVKAGTFSSVFVQLKTIFLFISNYSD